MDNPFKAVRDAYRKNIKLKQELDLKIADKTNLQNYDKLLGLVQEYSEFLEWMKLPPKLYIGPQTYQVLNNYSDDKIEFVMNNDAPAYYFSHQPYLKD